MIKQGSIRLAVLATLVVTGALAAGAVHAYTFIQNTNVGRTSAGYLVSCSDPGGFAHWNNGNIAWRLNTKQQGAGKEAAVQASMTSWNNAGTPHNLTYAGTTSAGFSTDGVNAILWARGNGCNGSCLAITALVLAAGQVITETDISFNQRYSWNTNGSDYDVQAVCTHELGHTLGMHHSSVTSATMYAYYSGTAGRTLESDDINGIQCSANRYPLSAPQDARIATTDGMRDVTPGEAGLTLASRARPGGALIRFGLARGADVRVQVYDIAGRHVTTLVDGFRAAGEHEVAWDGTSHGGRVGSGMYFARITGAGQQARASVILAE